MFRRRSDNHLEDDGSDDLMGKTGLEFSDGEGIARANLMPKGAREQTSKITDPGASGRGYVPSVPVMFSWQFMGRNRPQEALHTERSPVVKK